ncbi:MULTISPECIES: ABC transporter ATP-binding protein [Bacillus cereus group]|uniref:ABC transporter ATP-binding protein n=2 Tax=Bacillus cereus group TaxID=86661 RepID=UPI0001A1C6B0|nr:ABC transporter ATP-binding protein [Bacillus thuringiensis]EEM69065.1 ABC transporter [Bacillus thuringiensis serovar andalousiensis BGSC 4AW1]
MVFNTIIAVRKRYDMRIKRNINPLRSDVFKIYSWLISFIKPYRFNFIMLIFCGLLVSMSSLLLPKVIQFLIDSSLVDKNLVGFYGVLCGVILIVLIINFVIIPIQNIKQRKLQEYCSRDLQLYILQHLRKLDIYYYETNPSGKLLSILSSEVKNVQKLYSKLLPLFIQELLFAIVSIVFMLITSVQLTLIIIPALLVYYLFGPHIEKKASVSGKKLSDARISLNQKIYESISAIPELKVNNAQNWDLENVLNKQNNFNNHMILMYFYAFLRGTVRRMSYYLGGIVLIVFGYYLIRNNDISLGMFVAFFLYYFNAMHRITAVITFITEQKVLMYQAKNLYEFAHEEPKIKDSIAPSKEIEDISTIDFKDINFSYNSDQRVLDNFNLKIKKGERVVIVGKSGIGKTTIFKLLMRAYDPENGTICLNGKPINQVPLSSLRNFIGYVPQETYLFGSSVFDNIKFANPEATDEQVLEAAKLANAHEFISQLPLGYKTLLGERGIKLSGGQKQRVALARMFLKNPKLILLDEATSALDNTSETEVYSSLNKFSAEKTIIAIAHRISSIKNFDRIVVIDNGRVVESGTYEELIHNRGFFTKLINRENECLLEV